jgi:hypothetical protein
MATIASLALKVSADIGDLTKNIGDIINSVNNIAKVAGNATPSMKNLKDATLGYSIALDALKKAEERKDLLGGVDLDANNRFNEAEKMANKLKDTVAKIGESSATDILNMQPTIKNVMKAQQEIKRLSDLRDIIAQKGGDVTGINSAITQAETNMGDLARRVSETNIQSQMLNSTIMGMNSMPFIILSSILKEVLDSFKNIIGIWDENSNGLYGSIAKVIAGFVALSIVIGLVFSRQTLLNGASTYLHAIWSSSIIVQGLKGFVSLLGTVITQIVAAIWGTGAWTAAQWNLNLAPKRILLRYAHR